MYKTVYQCKPTRCFML